MKNELSNNDLIKICYSGICPVRSYSSQPEDTEKLTIWHLPDAKKNANMGLTESLNVSPAALSGLYFPHDQSTFSDVCKIKKKQAEDYGNNSKRRSTDEIEKWLRAFLSYDIEI